MDRCQMLLLLLILLQDRRAEHVKFQKHAHELMERVSGPAKRKVSTSCASAENILKRNKNI